MTEYEELVASVGALEITPEQKEAILSKAKEMNVELGKRGSDLINVKKEKDELSQKNMTYKAFAESMAKYNLSAEDLDKMAKNAGVEKTNQDAMDELANILKETRAKEAAYAEELRILKQEKQLGPKFDAAIKNFKHEDKPVVLRPAFIDGIKEELFKGIKEGEHDDIIQDRMNKALLQAKANQDKFLEANGLAPTDTPFHRVAETGLTGSVSTTGISVDVLKKVVTDGRGSLDSVAQAMALAREKQNK